ncbi:MAG: hypothetical protein LBK13_02835 [Spirochaetales bacterium]|nr:hypothetical protein [Spirochaetales bacterium]
MILLFIAISCAFSQEKEDNTLIDEIEIAACINFLKNEAAAYNYDDPLEVIFTYTEFGGHARKYADMFDNQKDNLETIVLEGIKSGNHWYIILAEYFKYESSINVITDYYVHKYYFYGWEGYDYDKIESFLSDNQYPLDGICIRALKRISGKDITDGSLLSEEQYNQLYDIYKKHLPVDTDTAISPFAIHESLMAYWKLTRLGYELQLYKEE